MTEDQPTHRGGTYMSVLRARSHVASTRAESNPTWVSVVWMSFKTALASIGKKETSGEKNDFLFLTQIRAKTLTCSLSSQQ